MKTNKIQNVVRARLAGFAAKIAEITEIEHSSTNGDLRETVLKDLVTSILPKQFSVRSGFICDVFGGVSRQLDLVVVDNTCTPEVLLQGDAAFIPVEAALVVIEIKATIKTGKKRNVRTSQETNRLCSCASTNGHKWMCRKFANFKKN